MLSSTFFLQYDMFLCHVWQTLNYVMIFKKLPYAILNQHVHFKQSHVEYNYVWFNLFIAGVIWVIGVPGYPNINPDNKTNYPEPR
jgi:hypothetical protein